MHLRNGVETGHNSRIGAPAVSLFDRVIEALGHILDGNIRLLTTGFQYLAHAREDVFIRIQPSGVSPVPVVACDHIRLVNRVAIGKGLGEPLVLGVTQSAHALSGVFGGRAPE